MLDTFVRLYDKVDEGKSLVDFDRFYELRYEDLVRDPVGQMGALYDHLGLGGFESVRPQLERYLSENRGYETNRYGLSDDQAEMITERWGKVIDAYGYERPPAERPAPESTRSQAPERESTTSDARIAAS